MKRKHSPEQSDAKRARPIPDFPTQLGFTDELLVSLPVDSLLNMCQTNKTVNTLCKHPYIWKTRFQQHYPKSFAILEKILKVYQDNPKTKCQLVMCEKNIRSGSQFNAWAKSFKLGKDAKNIQKEYAEALDCHRRGVYCTTDVSLGIIYKYMYLGEHNPLFYYKLKNMPLTFWLYLFMSYFDFDDVDHFIEFFDPFLERQIFTKEYLTDKYLKKYNPHFFHLLEDNKHIYDNSLYGNIHIGYDRFERFFSGENSENASLEDSNMMRNTLISFKCIGIMQWTFPEHSYNWKTKMYEFEGGGFFNPKTGILRAENTISGGMLKLRRVEFLRFSADYFIDVVFY